MIIFFDIETISIFNKDERTSEEFSFLQEKYKENLNFMPEFNKILNIVCWYENTDKKIIILDIPWTEEEKILKFFEITKWAQISWYNIKGFDIPFIIKRAMKYGIKIPNHLKAFWRKPREFENIIDLQEIWKHIWYSACSLWILCNFLEITNPKDFWIDGSQVQEFYDNWKEQEIADYCKRDVEATINVFNKFKENNLI